MSLFSTSIKPATQANAYFLLWWSKRPIIPRLLYDAILQWIGDAWGNKDLRFIFLCVKNINSSVRLFKSYEREFSNTFVFLINVLVLNKTISGDFQSLCMLRRTQMHPFILKSLACFTSSISWWYQPSIIGYKEHIDSIHIFIYYLCQKVLFLPWKYYYVKASFF